MPDSAVKTASPPVRNARAPRGADAASPNSGTDTEKKLARAARSAQRLAQLSNAPRVDTTPDLFAEDAERATLQAMNTDLRQGTLAGFELPEAFMAAVQSGVTPGGANGDALPAKRATRGGAAAARAAGDADSNGGIDAVPPLIAQSEAGDEENGAVGEPSSASSASSDTHGHLKAARPTVIAASAVRPVSRTASAKADAGAGASVFAADTELADSVSAPVAAPVSVPSGSASAPATVRPDGAEPEPSSAAALGATHGMRRAPSSLAAALIDDDRHHGPATSRNRATPAAARTEAEDAPELDRARATAFADTIDALYAVIADQRRAATAHSRRMKTMLTIIVCVMLVTVATVIAQTVVLLRMGRESAVQQQRIEQLMLNQEATLASFFDTDSANISTINALNVPRESNVPAPVQPAAAPKSDAAARKPQQTHAQHKSYTTAH